MSRAICLDELFTSMRKVQTTPRKDGSALSHIVVNCTLADLARATNLRVEDAAFALNECGLLNTRTGKEDGSEVVAITREMVDEVGDERKVKIMMMDRAHVLL
jgi:histone acetyltransferase MYST1